MTDREARLARALEARLGRSGSSIPVEPGTEGPLSSIQQSLWILHKLNGGSSGNRPCAVRLRGPLDPDGLRWALERIVDRHSVLRSTFPVDADGVPFQRIHDRPGIDLEIEDVTALPEGQRLGSARRIAGAIADRPLDLERRIPWSTTLIRLGEDDHVLVVGLHHVTFDGWSERVFQHELSRLLIAWDDGSRHDPLPPLPIRFLDYARWERPRLSDEERARHLEFWKSELAGLPEDFTFGGDGPSHPCSTDPSEAEMVTVDLGVAVTERLRALARESGSTLFMTLLAVLHVWLGREGRTDDVVIGVPTAGRSRPETEPLIGCFINTVLVRVDLSAASSFLDLLAHVRQKVMTAMDHQDLPHSDVVRELRPWGGGNRAPLYRFHFQLRDFPIGPVDSGRVTVSEFVFDAGAAGGALSLRAERNGDGLVLRFGYDPAVFPVERVRRFGDGVVLLLEEIVTAPSAPLSAPAADPAEDVIAAVASLFAEVLGLDRADADTDFFEEGGHSLLGARLMARIESRFGNRVSLAALFTHRTVGDIAGLVTAGVGADDEMGALVAEIELLTAGQATEVLAVLDEAGALA